MKTTVDKIFRTDPNAGQTLKVVVTEGESLVTVKFADSSTYFAGKTWLDDAIAVLMAARESLNKGRRVK